MWYGKLTKYVTLEEGLNKYSIIKQEITIDEPLKTQIVIFKPITFVNSAQTNNTLSIRFSIDKFMISAYL